MSIAETRKPTGSRRGNAIVFDPAERTLSTHRLENLDGKLYPPGLDVELQY